MNYPYINEIRSALVEWFEREQRDLPWRHTKEPYKIWVSEVMLQQTRVETVIPYYNRFLEKFPTMESFAYAPEEEILKMWEGLGYYSRVRNLQTGVREVVETYNGIVPSNRHDISKLKGVGPYTAGAILSIAYGVPEHAVDGNV
ncbi:MAG: A/G-specific adenine glycosylase, partial [Lysinibacillus sp.]